MDLQIRRMREELIMTINKYSIPLEVKRMVVGEILTAVAKEVDVAVRNQLEAENRQKEELSREETDELHETGLAE